MEGLTQPQYRAFAAEVALRQAPRSLRWIGALVLAITAVSTVVMASVESSEVEGEVVIGTVIIGLLLIADSFLLRRHEHHPERVSWEFAGAITMLTLWLLAIAAVWQPMPTTLIYAVIAMATFGPLTFAVRPFIIGSAVMVLAGVLSLTAASEPLRSEWLIGMLAAIAVGAITLRIRLTLLHDLADTEHAVELLATLDPLTGALNRRGLLERVQGLWADASRRQVPVTVFFMDIRRLKELNDALGHAAGDEVLRSAARAIASTVRGGDLLARWGGDEFIVIGVGEPGPTDAFGHRVNEAFIRECEHRRTGSVGEITVGWAMGDPQDQGFEELTRLADIDMYRRRRQLANEFRERA